MARYDKIFEFESNLSGKGLRIGIVMSRFNLDVCEGLLSACTAGLLKHGVAAEDIRIATVAGALEIALVLKKMAESGKFDALVALGAVIRGETYHFEIVSNEMASAITRVNLDTGIPVANGVLTTNTDHQATERMSEKGREAAITAIEMANLLKAI
ncbi:MAG: 6,7-dimethyl-8-ribityllumazine synthase [Thiobacillaceae bacterium]|jgi:6,7-dimethyl-8-ribityllumazine synthase|nr:6,7-dimethyl-8-ribityllumazine synthase [Thiobacillaceae bacterium]